MLFVTALASRSEGERCWWLPVTLFAAGWAFQFAGHAFERKLPEFFTDWRFLFVGVRWWVAKVVRRA